MQGAIQVLGFTSAFTGAVWPVTSYVCCDGVCARQSEWFEVIDSRTDRQQCRSRA